MKKLLLLLPFVVGVLCYFLFPRSPKEPNSYLQVPLHFSPLTRAPFIKVEIEGNKYSLLIDLGSSHPIDLQKQALKKIQHKVPLGTFPYFDMKGNTYLIPAFKVPCVKINETTQIHEISIHEENLDFLTKGSKGYPVDGFWNKILNRIADQLDLFWIDGRIGWTALKSLNWYFDFPHAKLVGARDVSTLVKKAGCCLEGFGKKKFLLDTGATRSVYRDLVDQRLKMHLTFGDFDFGVWEFHSFPIAEHIEIDGVLGADFFRNHAICLDFSNQMAYIQPLRQKTMRCTVTSRLPMPSDK